MVGQGNKKNWRPHKDKQLKSLQMQQSRRPAKKAVGSLGDTRVTGLLEEEKDRES